MWNDDSDLATVSKSKQGGTQENNQGGTQENKQGGTQENKQGGTQEQIEQKEPRE